MAFGTHNAQGSEEALSGEVSAGRLWKPAKLTQRRLRQGLAAFLSANRGRFPHGLGRLKTLVTTGLPTQSTGGGESAAEMCSSQLPCDI